jgi:hypothetical protein
MRAAARRQQCSLETVKQAVQEPGYAYTAAAKRYLAKQEPATHRVFRWFSSFSFFAILFSYICSYVCA